MSSRTSSRSTLTMTPSTMSPSLKYLIVWSTAARKSSDVPMSLTATWGPAPWGAAAEAAWPESAVPSVLVVMWEGAPWLAKGRRARCGPVDRRAGTRSGDEGGAPSSTACSVRGRAGPRRGRESTFGLVTGSIERAAGTTRHAGPARPSAVTPDEARRAARSWWDLESPAYQAEHGPFLGDASLVWGPEGLTEAAAGLLGP